MNKTWQCVNNAPMMWALGVLTDGKLTDISATTVRMRAGAWYWEAETSNGKLTGIAPSRELAIEEAEFVLAENSLD